MHCWYSRLASSSSCRSSVRFDFNLPDLLFPPTIPRYSKVFFTDYGSTPRVERCDMDGQNRTKLVDSKIVFPHGITLDLVNRMVYWADAYLDYIEVVDYEGRNRHTIIQGLLVRSPLKNCVKALRPTKKMQTTHEGLKFEGVLSKQQPYQSVLCPFRTVLVMTVF